MAVKKNDAEPKGDAKTIDDAVNAIADSALAAALEDASGAIIEPAITRTVDVSHESVDANPRAGATATQNAIDWNDAKRAPPQDEDFEGQGLDLSVYGRKGKA